MGERIRVGDLSALFVCPSRKWGTTERRAIDDSVYFRNIGGNATILCLKDSYIDLEAQKQDIPTIHFSGKKVNKNIDFSYYFRLRSVWKENCFDLVHCYNVKYLWALSLVLIRNFQTPLVLTYNNLDRTPFRGMIQRWLFRRVDGVVTLSEVTRDLARQFLPISMLKIRDIGLGLEVARLSSRFSDKEKNITCIIGQTNSSITKVETILNSVVPLLEITRDLSIDLKFNFYCVARWETIYGFSKILKQIDELKLKETVHFYTLEGSVNEIIQNSDIFVGTEFQEPVNDYELLALLYGIPCILPRTASRMKLIEDFPGVAESYAMSDARGFRVATSTILINYSTYKQQLMDYHGKLSEQHGVEVYLDELVKLYQRFYSKRQSLKNGKDSSSSNI